MANTTFKVTLISPIKALGNIRPLASRMRLLDGSGTDTMGAIKGGMSAGAEGLANAQEQIDRIRAALAAGFTISTGNTGVLREAEFTFGNGPVPLDVFRLDETIATQVKTGGALVGWSAHADEAPVGSDGTVDILKNGVSIFGPNPLATIPDGANPNIVFKGTAFATGAVAPDDRLKGIVRQIGSSSPGKGWSIKLYWLPA